MQLRWTAKLGTTLIFGVIGYTFPRFLIAVGLPLDDWANALGNAMHTSYVNFDVILWGFTVIFALSMLWVEGRFNAFERLFAAARPIKLSDEQIYSLTLLLQDAQSLIGEGFSAPIKADWQQRVVQWNLSVEDFITSCLPPVELISYNTTNVAPSTTQVQQVTHRILMGRRNKLRKMAMRLLPTHWNRCVATK